MSRPPLVASYFAGDKQDEQRANQLNLSIPCPRPFDNQGGGDVDRGTADWFLPCDFTKNTPPDNKTHHIHALALAQLDQTTGTVFVWGENANLKAYKFSKNTNVFPTFLAEGDEVASKLTKSSNGILENTKSPGGMPGGLLMVSAKPSVNSSLPYAVDPDTAIIWAVYPVQGDANKHFADGQLIAYDATGFIPGVNKLKRLFRTGDDTNGGLGAMTRMAPPVVANGKVYVMIYRVDSNNNLFGSQLKVFGLQ
jgi:signal peptidase I